MENELYTGGLNPHDFVPYSDRPTSLIQALASMPDGPWTELCREWGYDPQTADPWDLMADLFEAGMVSRGPGHRPITIYLNAARDISVTIHRG
jgi:hypothetical protein